MSRQRRIFYFTSTAIAATTTGAMTSFFTHSSSSSAQSIMLSSEEKPKYPYVILGSGTTAFAALETIKMGDPNAEILMISKSEGTLLPRLDTFPIENEQALNNPLDQRFRSIYEEWRRQLNNGLAESNDNVSLIRASRIEIDLAKHTITVGDKEIEYNKCLLATAGQPRDFYVLDREKMTSYDNSINTLHTALDFKNLATTIKENHGKHVTVVGGGYLGTEVVAALAESKMCKVTHVMGERTPLAQYLPQYLSEHVYKKLVSIGVDVRGEEICTGIKPRTSPPPLLHPSIPIFDGSSAALSLHRSMSRQENDTEEVSLVAPDKITLSLVGSNQEHLETDYLVLASTNVKPDLMGLENSGLEVVEGGIVTNASLEAYHGFFVAGDAATYFDPAIGRRRVDTYDHAVASGMWAAQNMLSEQVEFYSYQPSFRSSLAGIGLNFFGLGKVDANLETVGVWFRPGFEKNVTSVSADEFVVPKEGEEEDPYRRGIIYYLDRGCVVGVLLCNAGEMLDQAREVLRKKRIVTDPSELRKFILLAPSHWLNLIVTKK